MERILHPIRELAKNGQLTGILLIICTLISILVTNSVWGTSYLHFWETHVGPSFFDKSIEHWINDGLMVIFFFMVGLEIRRELVNGELSNFRKSLLAVLAAMGGMLMPALIYFFFNIHTDYLRGWAIPTATDIAFSLGILSLMGNRVPFALKIFLTALAIIDDLGAILVIAIFYTGELNMNMLLYAAITLAVLFTLNRLRIRPLIFYLVPGILLWWFILNSGIHATIAGVLLALLIPFDAVEPVEHALQKPVNFFIIPLFALANTAIALPSNGFAGILEPFGVGIMLGLLIGKPVGITLASFLSVKIGLTRMPESITWRKLIAVGFTAGIGFTMSIFIANLAFLQHEILDASKLAVLIGSMLAATAGLLILGTDRKRVNADAE